jgi:hypothetical protein
VDQKLVFTLLVPGVVGGYLPYVFRGGSSVVGGLWSIGWLFVVVGAAIYGLCLFPFLASGERQLSSSLAL